MSSRRLRLFPFDTEGRVGRGTTIMLERRVPKSGYLSMRFTEEAAYVGVFRSLYDRSPTGYRVAEA